MSRRFPRLETVAELNRLMEDHYARALAPHRSQPLAWVSTGTPVEILRAMDIMPVYPENYGAMCGFRGAVPLCEVAEGYGLGRDLCSYARISVGAILQGASAPLKGLGRPDLLICCNNSCGTIVKWFQTLAHILQVPLFVLDAPFLPDGLPAHALSYLAGQFEDLIRWLEHHTHQRLDAARLAEVTQLASETGLLWREIRGLCKARPSPLNAPELFLHMAPIVALRGTAEVAAFYRHVRDEVAARVRQGTGGIPEERFRLLWDNIAIWPRLNRFFALFADKGACFVADTYTGIWDTLAGPGEPLESLARVYLDVFLNRGLPYRIERMTQLVREYGCDGFVMHNNRSCKPFSLGQPLARRQVSSATGVPGLLIEADMCDTRVYADEPVRTRVEAFLETLAGGAG